MFIKSIYQSLWYIISPFIPIYLKNRASHHKEITERLSERYGISHIKRPDGPLIWIHGASVGESLSALSVVENFLADDPSLTILFTTGTVTSAALLEKRIQNTRFIHQFIPLDHPKWVRRFYDHWQPDAIIWLESEIWPSLLTEAKKRSIPSCLLNGRMSLKSFKLWSKFKSLAKDAISSFDLCLVQSTHDSERLGELGANNLYLLENLKYGATSPYVHSEEKKRFETLCQNRTLCLFASTHEGEEDQFFQIYSELKRNHPNLLYILAPRHPKRREEIERLADSYQLKSLRHSESKNDTLEQLNNTDVYLVDTIGDLGLFYELSSYCVIGGSFIPWGGHNPIEPAQCSSVIYMGPHYENFLQICADFKESNSMIFVNNSNELKEKLLVILKDLNMTKDYQKRATELVRVKKMTLDSTLDRIKKLFHTKKPNLFSRICS